MHSRRMHTARSSSHLLGDICINACWDTPWVWAWRPIRCGPVDPLGVGLETPLGQTSQLPPWVWAWRPPRPDQSTFPPGCGPGDPLGQTSQLPPWVWAWRPARHIGVPPPPGDLQGMLGYHHHPLPPMDRILDTRF